MYGLNHFLSRIFAGANKVKTTTIKAAFLPIHTHRHSKSMIFKTDLHLIMADVGKGKKIQAAVRWIELQNKLSLQ